MDKLVLDPCCSTRAFWFDKQDKRVAFCDKRDGERIVDVGTPGTTGRKPLVVKPDIIHDFRDMGFENESFYHVVFDPPHFYKGAGKTGKLAFSYGLLDSSWREDIKLGFQECFRVLKTHGTLVFKWCEVEIPLKEVLALTPHKPLYGHRSGKKAQTHWVAFIKNTDMYQQRFK